MRQARADLWVNPNHVPATPEMTLPHTSCSDVKFCDSLGFGLPHGLDDAPLTWNAFPILCLANSPSPSRVTFSNDVSLTTPWIKGLSCGLPAVWPLRPILRKWPNLSAFPP